jgi:diguanylate cyclase (GGDEF)-like protein/PAS domain S-box-containing protein
MSLRTRLLLLVALAALVPAILLGVRYFQNRADEINQALAALTISANNIATDLDEKIQGTAQLHFGLARSLDLDSPKRAECSAFLAAVREEYPQYTGILSINPDGKLFCDSLQTNRDLDLNDRAYFKKALAIKNKVTLQPVVGRLTGTSVLQIAYPARKPSGELKFVLLASLNLERFADIHRYRHAGFPKILLVDKSGIVVVPPPEAQWEGLIGKSIADTALFRLVTAGSDDIAKEAADIDGQQHFWALGRSTILRDDGLYVIVGISKDTLVAAANKRLFENLFALAIIAHLLFAGVWLLAEFGIRRQVGRIAEMAQKLGAGDLSVRVPLPHPGGELGGLMNELNSAAASLQSQHTAIHDLNQKLHQSQDAEARTKKFLDTVIEHVPLPISVRSAPGEAQNARDWRYTLVNKAYERLYGVSRDKILGKTVQNIFPRELAESTITSDRETLNSNAAMVVREYPIETIGNGTRLVTLKKVAVRDDQGKPQYLLAVLEDVTEKRRVEQRVEHMAHFDSLTELPNRAAFNKHFDEILERAATNGRQFTILSIDLDRFKAANDVYGHAAGDALLQEVARRLQAVAAGTFVARIGGDEFTLIVTEGKQPAGAAALADRLVAAFADDFVIEGAQVRVGLSIGGAVFPTDGTDAKTLMVNADAALYRAKTKANSSLMFFEPEMRAQLQERYSLQQDLRLAIDRGELHLHYQPQVRLGETFGFEALARWQCPKRGMVPPGKFIAIAEEYGLIVPLGEWVLREACREAASWPTPLSIAVNVSPLQFHHGDLPSVVHSILLETGLSPARLELEITEGVLIDDFSRALSILRRLKSLGVGIALDDFGTGYSSMSYLHAFTFDRIKIDRSFIYDLDNNRNSMAIVRAVIGLGRSLEIPVLAEGVETNSQRETLARNGCNEMQGYLTGRPFPISHYADLVGRQAVAHQNKHEIAS